MGKALISLEILIVGGGIGGLSAASFLAQDGHKVTVLEKQPDAYKSRGTGGIALFHNSISIFQQRNLWAPIEAVADSSDTITNISYTGQIIAKRKKPFIHSMIHRGDMLQALSGLAESLGVKVRHGVSVTSISVQSGQPVVTLKDGTILKADLVVGADGINSFIRQQMFSECQPQQTNSVVLLVDVPKAVMQNAPASKLWGDDPFHHTFGPERDIVSWSMTRHKPPVHHLQFCDHNYRNGLAYGELDPPNEPLVYTVTDPIQFRHRWKDFDARIQQIINATESYTKWKAAQLPPLDTYVNETSHIVLLGDAAHAVMPFAGQGANMSIEDGECLAIILGSIHSKKDIKHALKAYDMVRLPRMAGLRQIIELNVETFGLADGEAQKARDARLAGQAVRSGGTDWRKYGSLERWKWLESYDTTAETQKVLADLRRSDAKL